MTKRIIQELRDEVNRRGGRFLVIGIPAKEQFVLEEYVPYQKLVGTICNQLEIEYVDLFPYFEASVFRPFFRHGIHWNSYGHRVATEAINEYLANAGYI